MPAVLERQLQLGGPAILQPVPGGHVERGALQRLRSSQPHDAKLLCSRLQALAGGMRTLPQWHVERPRSHGGQRLFELRGRNKEWSLWVLRDLLSGLVERPVGGLVHGVPGGQL